MKIKLNKPFAANSAVDEFDVRQIKKALNRLGYYQPYEKTGITGIPDTDVFSALKTFQKDQGLQPTGTAKPGDKTIKTLSSEASKKKNGKYIWRTVGDNKVRDSHAGLDGTVRDLSDFPDPGEEFNCRCWGEPVPDSPCDKEREKYEELQQKVKELSERFNNLLLQLNEFREKNNALIRNARKSLGTRIVTYILTLPLEKLGILGDLLQRYFDSTISSELIKSADNFMRQVWAVRQKTQYLQDQISIVRSMLEKAAKELETAKEKLEECKENGKETR